MALYEHVYLARQDVSPQQVEALTGQFKNVIASLGGTVGKIEYWGVKSLAYRIKKNRKAHFTLMNIDAPPAAIAEMRASAEHQRRHSARPDAARRRAGGRSRPRSFASVKTTTAASAAARAATEAIAARSWRSSRASPAS